MPGRIFFFLYDDVQVINYTIKNKISCWRLTGEQVLWSRREEPRFRLCSCTRHVFGIRPLTCGARKRKPSTAGSLPSCCVTTVKIPSKFDLPSTAKNLPSCCVTAVKIPSNLIYRLPPKRYRQKREHRLPSKSYRHVALPSRPSPSKISLPNTAL